MVLIYTTCANMDEARKLGKAIISRKMGACVDYWPINSMYNWNGKFEETQEVIMMISTFEPRLEDVNDFISKYHSYSIPMIAGVDVRRINRAYKEWMIQEIA